MLRCRGQQISVQFAAFSCHDKINQLDHSGWWSQYEMRLWGIQMNTKEKWGHVAKWLLPGEQPEDAFKAYQGCVWWMLYQANWWRHADLHACVCLYFLMLVLECLSFWNSSKRTPGQKLSTGMPEGKWDIQCMISIKWSFSCSSSNEILYLCLRLLWLLDVTLRSCVTLYLLLTDDMTAGWPYQHQGCVSYY